MPRVPKATPNEAQAQGAERPAEEQAPVEGAVRDPFDHQQQALHPSGVRSIKVSWGEEAYYPIQYNGFRCGGIELVVDLHPGETVEEAYARTWALLEKLGKAQFQQKLDGYIQRAGASAQAARRAGGRN